MAFDNPPSYDYATQDAGKSSTGPPKGQGNKGASEPLKQPGYAPPPGPPELRAGPSYGPRHTTTVHHYVNPHTGEHVASVLPPDHPEMICLQQGGHIRRTKFGILGVLAAVFWFPLGIGLCLLDRRVKCDRCGYTLEDGILCG